MGGAKGEGEGVREGEEGELFRSPTVDSHFLLPVLQWSGAEWIGPPDCHVSFALIVIECVEEELYQMLHGHAPS